jgi:Fur family ferric uptake transcriptional regulator
MPKNQLLNDCLIKQGYSVTTARRLVFGALESQESITIKDLIGKLPGVDRSSVYRTIKLFEDLGIVKRVQIGWKYKLELSDNFSNHHHHAFCTNCKIILTLHEDSTIERAINSLARQHTFLLADHQLEIQGLCQACQV